MVKLYFGVQVLAMIACCFLRHVEAGGCPDATNFVYTEGVYDFSLVRDTTSLDPAFTQECTLVFQSPPGTVLSFDWTTFSLDSCASGESVKIFPVGEKVESAVNSWDPLCGAIEPPRTNFSGNIARLEVTLTVNSTSTFSMWVSHNANRLTFNLPENPAFALGSDISIDYEMHMARFSDVDQEDYGWIGLYAKGSCEDGFTAHECYLATRSVQQTTGGVSFFWGEYKMAGWYQLRYFAGAHRGTTCQDPATPSQIPVTEISQTLVMRLYENRGDSHMGNHSGYADDAEKFNSGVYRETYALAYAESIGVASGGVYLSGCSVTVTASSSRRGYINLDFVAIASSSAPSALLTGVPNAPTFRTNLVSVATGTGTLVVDIADIVTIQLATVDNQHDVATWTTVEVCTYEPLTIAEIYISTERSVYTPGTLGQQLPGYELTLRY